jgi:hypothetical protein
MSENKSNDQEPIAPIGDANDKRVLSPAALRALAEAAQRRETTNTAQVPEHDGPSGKEPTRFGDWERKGIAYDF